MDTTQTKRLVIFAHYDPDNLIDPYVLYFLQRLREIATDIVFVSASRLDREELDKIDSLTSKAFGDGHDEHDFGSYKRGFMAMEEKLADYDELLFVNDSVYGPIHPLSEIFATMAGEKCDFWGMFASYDDELHKWHLQSYFLLLRKPAFVSSAFSAFMHGIKKEENHRDLVVNYEVGLTDLLQQQGQTFASFFPKNKENSTYRNNAFAMVRSGFPLLKRRLVMENIFKVSRVYAKRKKLEEMLPDNYPWPLIDKHIDRIGKKYESEWFYRFANMKTVVLHRKFLRIYCTNKKAWYLVRIKLFGLSLFKLPIWFNRRWWQVKQEQGREKQAAL